MRTCQTIITPRVNPDAEYMEPIGDRPEWVALDFDGVTTQFLAFDGSVIVASISEPKGTTHLHLTVAQAEAMIATLQAAVDRSKGETEPETEWLRRTA